MTLEGPGEVDGSPEHNSSQCGSGKGPDWKQEAVGKLKDFVLVIAGVPPAFLFKE